MKRKLIKVVEVSLRKTKLGLVLARLLGKFVGGKKKYNESARDVIAQLHQKHHVECVIAPRKWERKYNLQIVIPMYNAAEYVDACITSILSQETKYTYQIVLVDDGSTDETIEKVNKYLSDNRVKLIQQKNAGAAAARNTGLKELVADYVMFVDIDDALRPYAIEKLLKKAYLESADIVEGGYDIFDKEILMEVKHEAESLIEPCGSLWGFPWGKVIRTELMQNISFPEEYWYEDTIMSYLVYTRSKSTYTIKDIVYGYRKNPSGFSHISGNNPKILDTYWVMELMLESMEKLDITFSQNIYEQFLQSILTGCKRMMFLNKEIRQAALSQYSQILNAQWEKYETQDPKMRGFEKAIRNNQYGIFRLLVVCM